MVKDVRADQVRRALREKGFRESQSGVNRDHEFYLLWVDDRKTNFWVKLSRGAKFLYQREVTRNAKSVGVKADDLYRILSCEHDAARTAEICRSRAPAGPWEIGLSPTFRLELKLRSAQQADPALPRSGSW